MYLRIGFVSGVSSSDDDEEEEESDDGVKFFEDKITCRARAIRNASVL